MKKFEIYMHLRERLFFWLGIFIFFVYLLPNHYSPWLSFHQEFAVALAFLPLIIWSSFGFCVIPVVAIGAGIFSLLPLLQIVVGKLYFCADGWMGALYLQGFSLAINAGACGVAGVDKKTLPDLERLVLPWVGLLLAAIVSVGIQISQWLLLGNGGIYMVDMPPNGRPFGNLAQPNQLATLLLLGIAGLMFLWESNRLSASVGWLVLIFLVFGLVMTGSRSVLLTVVWLVPTYSCMRRRCGLRTKPIVLIGVFLFYILMSLSWVSINNFLILGIDANVALDRLSETGIRKTYWLSMIDAVLRSPWTGYGWGQIGFAQMLTTLDYPSTHSIFDSSHNLFLDVALWSGLPIAFFVFVGLIFWFSWQLRQCRDPLAWTLLIAIGIVLSHAMVEYPLHYAYFLLPVGLWMGALSARYPCKWDYVPEGVGRWLARRGIPLFSAGSFMLLAVVVSEYFPLEKDWSLMRFQEQRIGSLEPTDPPPAMVLTHLREYIRISRLSVRPGMVAQDVDAMRRVSDRFAYASVMYRYALAQGLNAQPKGAQQTLARMCHMHSVNVCIDAQREWSELARERYPQLNGIPFPIGMGAGETLEPIISGINR